MASTLALGALKCGTVADISYNRQPAPGNRSVHVLADANRCEKIVIRLNDQGGGRDARQFGPVVRQEGDACEVFCNVWIGPTKAVDELISKVRLFRRAHDGWSHRARPTEEIVFQRFQQFFNVRTRESAVIFAIVYERGRGSHHDVGGKALGRPKRSEHSDCRADRVPDEDNGTGSLASSTSRTSSA